MRKGKTGIEILHTEKGTLTIDHDNELGHGAYGVVKAGTYSPLGNAHDSAQAAAVKIIPSKSVSANSKETKFNEIQKIIYEEYIDEEYVYIAMPYLGEKLPDRLLPGENIKQVLSKEKEKAKLKSSIKPQDPQPEDPQPEGSSEEYGTFVSKDDEKEQEPFGTFIPKNENKKEGIDKGVLERVKKYSTLEAIELERKKKEQKLENLKDNPLERPGSKTKIIEANFDKEKFKLDLLELIDMFEKMADAVDSAHQNGILHLDIKNENFLFDPATERMTLVDFGVSEFVKDGIQQTAKGTPFYMAPELLIATKKNKEDLFSVQQDIYSLGRTFFALLSDNIAEINKDSIENKYPINGDYIHNDIYPLIKYESQLRNIQFKNPSDIKELRALNELIALINEMTKINPKKRSTNILEIKGSLSKIKKEFSEREKIKEQYAELSKSKEKQAPELVDILKDGSYSQRPRAISNLYVAKSLLQSHNIKNKGPGIDIPDDNTLYETIEKILSEKKKGPS